MLLRIADVFVAVIGILGMAILTSSNYFKAYESNWILWISTFVVYFLMMGEIFELYHKTKNSDRLILARNIVLTAFFTTLFYLFTPKITPELPHSRIEIVYVFLGMSLPLMLWRMLYNVLFYKDLFLKNLFMIGTKDEILKSVDLIKECSIEHKVMVYITENEVKELSDCQFYPYNSIDLQKIVTTHKIKTLLISDLFDKAFSVGFSGQLIQLFKKGVTIESFYEFNEKLSKRLSKYRFNESFYHYFTLSNYYQDSIYLGFVRIFDLIISMLGMFLLGLLIPLITLLNLVFNRGPLFYTQTRIGIHGEPFKIYKLRTMRPDAENGNALWASKNDIRATAFGHFLRKTRIDEMPQFLNILKGEMNIIGPRPERPEFVNMLEQELPYYAMRHIVKPGLTGWAQVEYPYANSIPDQEMKLRYDLYYIKERTPLLDFKIILKTINTVLFYKGY